MRREAILASLVTSTAPIRLRGNPSLQLTQIDEEWRSTLLQRKEAHLRYEQALSVAEVDDMATATATD